MTLVQNHQLPLNGNNMKITRYTTLVLALLWSMQLFSQNYQAEYLEAKRLFANKDYKSAKGAFQELAKEARGNTFSKYASFFYALSCFFFAD